jgi:hypothetical protein
MKKRRTTCPVDARYRLILDPAEYFADDPGQGTPALVEGPQDTSGTYFCALETGEVDGRVVPLNVYRWLCDIEFQVEQFMEAMDESA